MVATLFIIFLPLSYCAVLEDVESTEGLKARATLKFAECNDPLLPQKYCLKEYRDTIGVIPRLEYDCTYPNKTHEDETCTALKKMTSCEYLEHLTKICGAHYDDCHSIQEKREIMRMWIKQFIRGTHEVYWEFLFTDDNQKIINGECNEMLEEFFDEEEIPDILRLIDSGPNKYRELENTFGDDNYTMLIPTKISNLTRKFGVMVDQDGNRIGGYNTKYEFQEIWSTPSHWKYCMWKMKHNIIEKGLFLALGDLFRCDGKCNTNDGDDQEWNIGSLSLEYFEVKDKDKSYYERVRDGYPGEDLIQGDNSIFSCVWGAQFQLDDDVSNNIGDMDKAKMGLCRPFKTLFENCSIPIGECIGNIAVKEIVMTEYLKMIIERIDLVMEIAEKHTTPGIFGGFTYDDCEIFGGNIAGVSSTYASWVHITVLTMVSYYVCKN